MRVTGVLAGLAGYCWVVPPLNCQGGGRWPVLTVQLLQDVYFTLARNVLITLSRPFFSSARTEKKLKTASRAGQGWHRDLGGEVEFSGEIR